MTTRVYTVSTRLRKDSELVKYMSDYITDYNRIYRYAWHIYTSKDYSFKSISIFRTHLCVQFGILGRTANSIIHDIQATLSAYKALKRTELHQLNVKIQKKEKLINSLIEYINTTKAVNIDKRKIQKYRRSKQSLYYQKNKLNKMKQQRNNLKYQIDSGIVSIGFGSKKQFQKQYLLGANGYKTHEKWYNDYVKSRDKTIYYIGSNNETQGNQMFQMYYNEQADNFTVRVRKDFGYDVINKYATDIVDFKYQKDLLKTICLNYKNKVNENALSYRVHRVGSKWYLQVMFSIEREDYVTTSKYGVLGLDYNNGFIAVSETDTRGNLVNLHHFNLRYHGTGSRAKTEIEQTIAKIVNISKNAGKDIVIENLNFKQTKAVQSKSKTKSGKYYNKMLHSFDYNRYKETMLNSCHRHGINLIMVNPKNTSKIGRQKYADKMKLNIHQAASFVIARKGQGYTDNLI